MQPSSALPSAPVAGIVLAAGGSSRMGSNKMLLPFGEETVLRRSVRCALAGGLDPVLVVLGYEAERARLELEGLPCRAIVNPEWARGMNSSLAVGIEAVPSEAHAAVVALADMPRVTAAMIAGVVEHYRRTRSALVASDYGGILAPPTLFDRRLFDELRERDGEGCGRRVVQRHLEDASTVTWPAAALGDLDRPADYQRLLAEMPPRS